MSEFSISGSKIPDDAPESITLVTPGGVQAGAQTNRSLSEEGAKWLWVLHSGGARPQKSEIPEEPQWSRLEWRNAPPPCVHDFVRAAAKIKGVQCIVVEEGDLRTVHITTFAEPLTEEVEAEIYKAEVDLILANPNLRFDFHSRRAAEAKGGLKLSAGQHYFGIWGSLDAGAR